MTISGLIRPPSPTRFPAARYPCRRCQSEPRPQGRNEKLEPDAGKLARPVLRGGDGGHTAPLPGGTVFLKRLYVLFFLELASRRILFTACSDHVGGAWAAQQARNLAWQLQEAAVKTRFLIHDRDANFPAGFDAVFRAEGLEVIRTPVRAPNANSRCERWVSSVRRECLDRLLILNRRHLEAVLAEYVEHYNWHRPHRRLGLRPPRGPNVIPVAIGGEVVRRTRVHGLINEYSRQAA